MPSLREQYRKTKDDNISFFLTASSIFAISPMVFSAFRRIVEPH